MKRKNKPIRRPDAVQPLPLPADAGEIAFAHGVSRRVVVVDAAESPLFEQIIYSRSFILSAMMLPAAASRRRIWCSRRGMPSAVCRRCLRPGRGKNPIPAC